MISLCHVGQIVSLQVRGGEKSFAADLTLMIFPPLMPQLVATQVPGPREGGIANITNMIPSRLTLFLQVPLVLRVDQLVLL
jgi:hypothetical protein